MVIKFAQGGFADLLVGAVAPPALELQLASSTKSESSSKDNKVGLKDLLGLVKELKGLPTDSDILIKLIQSLYDDMSISAGGELDPSEVMSVYLSILRGVRNALFNEEQYKEAKKLVISNGGLNEIAIDNRGNLIVQDKETGLIGFMSAEQFKQLDESKYEALTNSNLLYYRANNPQFAFKNEVLGIVENGIGIEAITKHLLSVASKIGANTLRSAGYSEKNAEDISKGIEVLEEAANLGLTVTNLYTQGVMSKDLELQAKLALAYLWNTLPTNAKTLLKVKGGSEDGAKLLIQNLIFSELDYESTVPHSDKNKKGNDKTGKVDDKGIKNTEAIGFYFGMGEEKLVALVPNSDYGYAMTVRAGVLTGHSGEALKEYDTLADVASGAYAGMLDIDNATFGGASIDTLSKVFLRNSTIYSVELPIDIAYKNSTGKVRPDVTLAQRMSQLNKAIQDGEIDRNNIDQVNAKCKELNLPEKYIGYDDQGHPILNGQVYSRFARIAAFIDENSLENEDDVQGWARNLATDQERKNFLEHMKTVDKNYKLSSGIWGSDDLYDGIVFIPIRESVMAATYGGGEYYKYPSDNAITAELKDRDNRALNTYVLAPTLNSVKK